MTDLEKLEALADRCEREKPSRELDDAIQAAVNPNPGGAHYWGWLHYTTSLDAAVALVPEGAIIHLYDLGEKCKHAIIGFNNKEYHADWCKTLSLAICAASLRARDKYTTNLEK